MDQSTNSVPQASWSICVNEGGFETTMLFLKGFDFPDFCAWTLILTEKG